MHRYKFMMYCTFLIKHENKYRGNLELDFIFLLVMNF